VIYMLERRIHKRIFIQDSSMICRDETGKQVNVARIRDISHGGIGFLTRDDLDIGSEVRFDFILPKKNGKTVHGIGHVVWKSVGKDIFGNSLVRCGIRFKNLPANSQQVIDRYIRSSRQVRESV